MRSTSPGSPPNVVLVGLPNRNSASDMSVSLLGFLRNESSVSFILLCYVFKCSLFVRFILPLNSFITRLAKPLALWLSGATNSASFGYLLGFLLYPG